MLAADDGGRRDRAQRGRDAGAARLVEVRARMEKGLNLVLEAAVFAAERHRGQVRKGADARPFINHPLEVAWELAVTGRCKDPEMIAAAILHDTIEDTATVHDDIADRFGRRVARLVAELTDDKRLPKKKRKLEQIRHAGRISRAAQQIKLADKLCNLREMAASPPADWPAKRRREYYGWSRKVVQRMRGANPALERQFDAVYAKGDGHLFR